MKGAAAVFFPTWRRRPAASSDDDVSATPGCRPASTTPATTGRCCTPRPRPGSRPTAGRSRSTGWSSSPTTWTWDEIHALPPSRLRGRHPLRHDLVEVRHDVRRRLGRHAAGRGRPLPPGHLRPRLIAHRLHHQPAAGRRHRREGVGRVGRRRATADRSSTAARPGCSCRTCTSGRAPSGCRACACSTTTSPGSGSATATTTAATPGSSSATRATERDDHPRRHDRPPHAAAGRPPTRAVGARTRPRTAEHVPAAHCPSRAATSPGSTTWCGSPRPTATPRRARTRSRRRPTTRARSS